MSQFMPSPMLAATAERTSLWHSIWHREPDAADLRLKVAYIALQVLDLILTVFAIKLGAVELNPMMRAALNSPLQMTVLKGGLPLWFVWMLPGRLLIPAIVLLLFIVGWDAKELLMLAF
jgi:hypothetical protein